MTTKSKNSYWKSRAVTWLLKESKSTDIEMYMRQQAKILLSQTGQYEPPFSPERVAVLRNVKQIEEVQIHNISELITAKAGFIIRINPELVSDSIKRYSRNNLQALRSKRFTIAHEIGHTFFYEKISQNPSRPFGDLGSAPEERLCDIFATELLMPNQRFLEDAKVLKVRIGNHVEIVLQLGRLYNMTLQPIIYRLYEVGILDTKRHVTIKWNYRTNPNKPQNKNKKLRIEWSYPYSYPFIPRLISAKTGSIFDIASHNTEFLFQESDIKIGSINGKHFVEAISIRNPNNPSFTNKVHNHSILSIIHLADPTKLF